MVAPSDSDRIFALEATSGNLLWETDLPRGSLDAVHLLGISDDIVLSTFYRHERGARIYDGPDEVHRSVLARHVLRNYGVELE